jgi:ATP-dependent DNA helicase DinG
MEVEVHQALRTLLRSPDPIDTWPHHLTLARLVARAMRISKSALIQTGLSTLRRDEKYRLGYLVPALLGTELTIIVISPHLQSTLIERDLPQLQTRLGTTRPIYAGTQISQPQTGIWILAIDDWLANRLATKGVITILDGLDNLEPWVIKIDTLTIVPADWEQLRHRQSPQLQTRITDDRIELTRQLWLHPPNPYNCYLLTPSERDLLIQNLTLASDLPPAWQELHYRANHPDRYSIWATIDRHHGTFNLAAAPIDPNPMIASLWQDRPLVAIAGFVDPAADAATYRQQIGSGELTCVKFSPDRRSQVCQLYLPRWIPAPNTPNFQPVLTTEIDRLLRAIPPDLPFFVTILVQDTPLQTQLATVLAASWGSRVKLETLDLKPRDILICGWDFWRDFQNEILNPQLTIVATIPIPSLEDPAVAARVQIYKQNRQDWFRLYLLPAGLRTLHQAIVPLRDTQGTIAIFDNRIDRRSYGQQIITALSPIARIDRPEGNL